MAKESNQNVTLPGLDGEDELTTASPGLCQLPPRLDRSQLQPKRVTAFIRWSWRVCANMNMKHLIFTVDFPQPEKQAAQELSKLFMKKSHFLELSRKGVRASLSWKL